MNGVCNIVGDCTPSDVYYNGDAVSVSHVRYHPSCEASFSDAYMSWYDEARGCLVVEFHAPGTAQVGDVSVTFGDGITVKGKAQFLIHDNCVAVWLPWVDIEVNEEYTHPNIPEKMKITSIYAVDEMPVCIMFDVWREGWVTPLYGMRVGRLLCYPGAEIHGEAGLPYDVAFLQKICTHKL
jgi:hypothetical protein